MATTAQRKRDTRGRFVATLPMPHQSPDLAMLTADEVTHVNMFITQPFDDWSLVPLACVADRLTERGDRLGEDLALILTDPACLTAIKTNYYRPEMPHVKLYTEGDHNERLVAEFHNGTKQIVKAWHFISGERLNELVAKYYPDDLN